MIDVVIRRQKSGLESIEMLGNRQRTEIRSVNKNPIRRQKSRQNAAAVTEICRNAPWVTGRQINIRSQATNLYAKKSPASLGLDSND